MTTILFVTIYLIGIIYVLPFSKDIPIWLIAAGGFVWGSILWVIVSTLVLFLGLQFSWQNIVILHIPFIILAFYSIIRNDVYKIHITKWGVIVFGVLVTTVTSWLFTRKSYVFATADSFAIINHGRILGQYGLIPWSIDHFTKRGLFIPVLQMASKLLPGDFLSGYQTIFAISLLAILVGITWSLLNKVFNKYVSFVIASLLTMVSVTQIFAHHTFYIHINLPAGTFMLISTFSFWKFLQEKEAAWIWLGNAGIFGLGFTRIEGPIYASLIIILAASVSKLNKTNHQKIIIPYAVSSLVWHIYLYFSVTNAEQLSKTNIAIFILALLGVFLFGLFGTSLNNKNHWLPEVIIFSLLLLLILSIFIKPLHMYTSISNMFINSFQMYTWGISWIFIIALLPLLTKCSFQHNAGRFLKYSIIGYVFIVVLLSFLRMPYRLGETDSANRLFVQLMPIMIFYIVSNSENIKNLLLTNQTQLPNY